MAKNNGAGMVEPTPQVEQTVAEKIEIMREHGWKQIMPMTGRVIMLKSIEPDELLLDGDCPDILTPLLLRSIYKEMEDEELREFLNEPLLTKEDALDYLSMLNLVCRRAITDGTPIEKLTLPEKRWIFRLVLAPSEFLVFYSFEPSAIMASLEESDTLPQVATASVRPNGEEVSA